MSISSVTSEALQLKLRQLLPSQQGFGSDLSASDTIIPIIDLTASAEGSDVREDLQKALSHGSNTEFSASNASTDIITTTGFFRIIGSATLKTASGQAAGAKIKATDGATTKKLFNLEAPSGTANNYTSVPFDIVVFVPTGDTISAESSSGCNISGSTRQIADVNGTLVQTVGFSPQ
jgi:hypothetical protein